MKGGSDVDHAEIVIVRRRAADDMAAGKAGAWKIAYADFVTAMMAFFLVMWLINASNEETRAQVASYFNPIKLTDSSTGARSLKDMKDTRSSQNHQAGEAGQGSPPANKDVKQEAELMANPPQSLDRIARTMTESNLRNAGLETAVEIAPSMKPDASNPGVGDPFDPRSWEKADQPRPADVKVEGKESPKPADPRRDSSHAHDSPPKDAVAQQASALSDDIAERLEGDSRKLRQDVDVKVKNGGLLVSLTENADFEMFKNGSAEPEPQMLKLVDAVAGALQARPGTIVIRGHTDSRPYRNKYYDNWQLSTARANLARYMLIRGGVPEGRIRRVEGVADLEPRNARDPQAPENRRIEIFIDTEAP